MGQEGAFTGRSLGHENRHKSVERKYDGNHEQLFFKRSDMNLNAKEARNQEEDIPAISQGAMVHSASNRTLAKS